MHDVRKNGGRRPAVQPPGKTSPLNPRPLVLRFGAIGDMVLLTSALTMLHRRWSAPVDVVTREESQAAVLAGLPEVGEVLAIGSRREPFLLAPGQHRLVRWLRRRGPGPTWVIDPVAHVYRLLERGGISNALQVREIDHPWQMKALEHHRDWLLRIASLDPPGIEPRAAPDEPAPLPHLAVDPAEDADCEHWLEERGFVGAPVVVVQTEARRRKRGRWPAQCWREVLRGIAERIPSAHAVVVGTKKERAAVEAVVKVVDHSHVHAVAGELTLRGLIALLARAHSCVSLDTGPAHIAAAVGCPVAVVIGPVHPDLYRPVGRPGLVEVVTGMAPDERPRDHQLFYDTHRMEMVEPQAVLAAWESVCAHRDNR